MGCVMVIDDARGYRSSVIDLAALNSLDDLASFASRYASKHPYLNMFLRDMFAMNVFFEAIIHDLKGLRQIAPMHLQPALDVILEAISEAEHYIWIAH